MKAFILIFICLFLLSASTLDAAPVGNPTLPGVLKSALFKKDQKNAVIGIIAGPEADFTTDRNIKNQSAKPSLYFYGGKAGVVVADKLFLYGICGIARAEQEFKVSSTAKVYWETEGDLAWGTGGALLLYEKEIEIRQKAILRVGVDGRYRRLHLEVDKVRVKQLDSSGNVTSDTEYILPRAEVADAEFSLDEWQVAAGVSCQFDKLIPYVGCKYSDFDGDLRVKVGATEYKVGDYKTTHKVGIFTGLDFLLTDSILLNGEARFVDETAFTLGGAIRF